MKNKIAVIFGGANTEHEVSVVTAIQAMNALKEAKYEIIPLYITKDNLWILGDETFLDPITFKNTNTISNKFPQCYIVPGPKPTIHTTNKFRLSTKRVTFDIAFPVFHGKNGEDGTIQGMLKLLNIPYAGCTHIPSAIGIDKHISKRIAADLGILTTKDVVILANKWKENRAEILNTAYQISPTTFVKPAKLGSSIGITKTTSKKQLEQAIDVAFAYDTKVLVEEAIKNMSEVNISILGNNPYQVSVTEMPAGSDEILSFQDKYLRSSKKTKSHKQMGMASLQRQIPAPIASKYIKTIESQAKSFFGAIEGRGMARIDFMITKDNKIYFNEINTIPGSLSFYLWKDTGLPFPKLVDKLVKLAQTNWNENQKLTKTFSSNILSHYNENAAKGAKNSQ